MLQFKKRKNDGLEKRENDISHMFQVPSQLQQLLAASCLLYDKVLPPCYTDLVLESKYVMICNFWQWWKMIFFREREFQWIWLEFVQVSDQSSTHHYSSSFNHSMASHRLSVKIGQKNKFTCSVLNPVQSSRPKLTTCPTWQEKGVWSDSNWTAQPLQMTARKSMKMISGMILNPL